MGPSPVDRARPGSKHHLLVDATGIPLAWTVTGGNRNDVTQLVPLLERIPPVRGKVGRPRRRPQRVTADRGYDHDKYRRELRRRGIAPEIARRQTQHGSGLGRARWVVEATQRGTDPDTLVRQVCGRARDRTPQVSGQTVQTVFDRLAGPDGLTAQASTFARPDVIVALGAGLAGAGRQDLEALADRFLSERAVSVVADRALEERPLVHPRAAGGRGAPGGRRGRPARRAHRHGRPRGGSRGPGRPPERGR
jgi:IS5 family transposase